MSTLPAGDVTFLFADIEGSTRLVRVAGQLYPQLLADTRRMLRDAIDGAGGHEVEARGDELFAVFQEPRAAVDAAIAAQRELSSHEWPADCVVRVRMGVHAGKASLTDEGYTGIDVHRAARITSAGHGGQILVSETTRALLGNDVPDGVSVHDLGKANLKDVQHEHIYELAVDGERSSEPIRTHQEGPKSAGEQLAERIHRHVEQQIEASLSGKPAEGKRLEETTVRAAASGLLILAMTLLTIAAVIIGIVLLVKLAF